MKRRQLIEWGIVTIGLIFGYKFFEGIFTAFLQIMYLFGFEGAEFVASIIPSLIMIAVYAVCFILLIRNSQRIAVYIDRPGAVNEDNIMIRIGKRSLLQVILIGICITTILTKAGDILIYLFETFKSEAGGNDPFSDTRPTINGYQFRVAAVQTIIAIVALYFSKDISGWFVRRNEADELVFDSESENK